MSRKELVEDKICNLKDNLWRLQQEIITAEAALQRIKDIYQGFYNEISPNTEFKSVNDVFEVNTNPNPGMPFSGDSKDLEKKIVKVIKDLLYLREGLGPKDE